MKNYVFALVLLLLSFSCLSIKEVSHSPLDQDQYNAFISCSGIEFGPNSSYFRAQSIGVSLDQILSKKKALSFARADLAQSLKIILEPVLRSYLFSLDSKSQDLFKDQLYAIQREVIKEFMNQTNVACENLTKNALGKFKTYLVIEKSSEAFMNQFKKRVMLDPLLKMGFDYNLYEKYFLQEMKKLDSF
ncbi:MAG: hypothetical protein CMP57_00465 [Flavobacteriales bacterium]|nr:hypothetical protein [Flavobacteriales bacterium]|tara:strand:+ start:1690 stop:2256 length:567 start_codon:yes stop_codon:yes gene_type:complete